MLVGLGFGVFFFSVLSPFANPAKFSKVQLMLQGLFVQKGFWATINLYLFLICWLFGITGVFVKGGTCVCRGGQNVADGSFCYKFFHRLSVSAWCVLIPVFPSNFTAWRDAVPSDVEGHSLVLWSIGQLRFSGITRWSPCSDGSMRKLGTKHALLEEPSYRLRF